MASGDISVRFRRGLSALLILPIRFYQLCISPFLPKACRFYPSCSEYACTAIHRHGPLTGTSLATKRILSCHPWGAGGMDPVPEKNEA